MPLRKISGTATGRVSIVLPLRNMPVACFRQKKSPDLSVEALCSRYLSSRVGRVLSRCPQVSGGHLQAQKRARISPDSLVFALPIFPGSHPPSIVGVHELNFCVRNGNRWTLMTINTNYIIVQLSLLQSLVTHTGFEPMLTA